MNQSSKNIISILALLIITIVLEALLFGDIFFHPNQFGFMMNPDGTQIYFNYLWHVKYGNGTLLTNQNYPFYELIFMTDAQASISILMSFINHHIYNIEPYSIGIFNVIILLGFPICTYFLFKIFKHLNVSNLLSILFALIICFLSPQIVRITSGHYGLGYLFYFPALIYLMFKLTDQKASTWKYVIGISFLLIFFGLNNGHMSLAGGMQVLSFGFFWWILHFKQKGLKKILPLLVSVFSLGIIFMIIHGLDFVKDRESLPWGFLNFYSRFESIFIPTHGFIFDTINKWIKVASVCEEGVSYVGFVGLLALGFTAYRWIFKSSRHKLKRLFNPTLHSQLNVLLIASLPILFFSMAFPFRWGMESLLDSIPFIRQFRSPGRFAWIFYYAFSIYSLYLVYLIFRRINFKWKWVGYLLIVLVSFFYFEDIKEQNSFSFRYLNGHNYDPNLYLHSDTVKNTLSNFHINKDEYQGIFGIPLCNAWNAKFGRPNDPSKLVRRMAQISVESEIPWLNAKLSRISTSGIILSAQLVSNPIIVKELLQKLPNDKKLLLMHPTDSTLTSNEHAFFDKAIKLGIDNEFTYYSLQPSAFTYPIRDSIVQYFTSILNAQKAEKKSLIENGLLISKFETDTIQSFPYQDRVLFEGKFKNAVKNQKMEFSIWTKFDYKTDGGPWIEYAQTDSNGNWVEAKYLWSASCEDYQHGFIRMNIPFTILDPRFNIAFKSRPGKGFIFERLSIRPSTFNLVDSNKACTSFNNYILNFIK